MNDLDEWRAPGLPVPPSTVLAAALARLDEAYDAVLAIAPSVLSDEDLVRLVDAMTRVADRSAGALTAAIGEADRRRLGDAIGARHTGQWWSQRSLLTRPEANRLTHLGRRLSDPLHAPVRAALEGGVLHVEQARSIVTAVDAIPCSPHDLPSHVEEPAAVKGRAVEHLLVLAKDHDARQLAILGRRILDLVAPEVGEAAEARALADEEAVAARKLSLTLHDCGDGTATGRFTLPVATAQALRKQLMAIAAPRHQRLGDASADVPDRDERPLPVRLGSAFVDWIERYPADRLPSSGGTSATVVVTMSLDSLTGGLAAASLDTGARISAAEARRLACEAGIVPAVLGGTSEVLDLGRTRRFHSKAQRLVIAHRDGGCTAQGCDLPPAACHVHHDQHWSRGGSTDTATGRLLCHRHHRVIHDQRYDTTHHPDGSVSFHRRT
ncbi:HNH endonuclease signature motif containing protein [Nocardioides currus]|nr:HNH endonuclease signature motif containing protein [Nocardioides currus]